MSANIVASMVKLVENLPEPTQKQVLAHLHEYVLGLEAESMLETEDELAVAMDEARWDEQFARTQDKLAAMADQALREIEAGLAIEMDYEAL